MSQRYGMTVVYGFTGFLLSSLILAGFNYTTVTDPLCTEVEEYEDEFYDEMPHDPMPEHETGDYECPSLTQVWMRKLTSPQEGYLAWFATLMTGASMMSLHRYFFHTLRSRNEEAETRAVNPDPNTRI